jgi:molybdopterin-guanine dinucleotide biosynthesis protein B
MFGKERNKVTIDLDVVFKQMPPRHLDCKEPLDTLPSASLSYLPVIAVSGYSNSGKTMLVERLVGELVRRGYRVATIKHTHHDNNSCPGKDTRRHIDAGSVATMLAGPHELEITRRVRVETSLGEMVAMMGSDWDILICEGFKREPLPGVWLYQEGGRIMMRIEKPGSDTNTQEDMVLSDEHHELSGENISTVCDMLEEDIIRPRRGRVSISVNGKELSLAEFPASLISNTITGMLSALEGADGIESVNISLKRDCGGEKSWEQ